MGGKYEAIIEKSWNYLWMQWGKKKTRRVEHFALRSVFGEETMV